MFCTSHRRDDCCLYVVLTMIANALGIASGNIQVRFSGSPHRPSLSDSRRSSRTLYRLSDRQPRDRCHASPDIIFGSLATLIGAIGTWMLGKATIGKDEKQKSFSPGCPSAAYPGKRRDYPACVKIRLRHPSDVVFRDYRNGRGNHFLRYLRTDSVGCAEKIQKPVVPRLNGKKHKRYRPPAFGGYDTFFFYLQ